MKHTDIEKKELTTTGENPLATNLSNLISRVQMNEIKQLSDELGLAHSYISQKLFELPYDHLSKSGADDVINILTEMKSLTETVH